MPEYKIITGVPTASAIRYEFSEWYNNGDNDVQVSLFVRGLNRFMNEKYYSYKDRDSFYGVAGIHGFPNVPWDETPNTDGAGFYCIHNNYTFPTFHRPYVALYEQRIYEEMKNTIDQDLDFADEQEKARWHAEADKWRLPYWDWARLVVSKNPADKPRYGVPEMCTLAEVEIVLPRNPLTPIEVPKERVSNPMWAYRGDGMLMGDASRGDYAIQDADGFPWGECYGTSRYGIKPGEKDIQAKNNYVGVQDAISNADFYNPSPDPTNPIPHVPNSLPDKVYRLYNTEGLKTWGDFASTKHNPDRPIDSWADWLSLEFIHNNLHNWTGGDDMSSGDGAGHMCDVPVAAFDPIFFLHHCNVDRLLAIWQALNPDNWFDNLYFAEGDVKVDPTTQLLPFRGEGAEIFDSDRVRDWKNFNYQYKILDGSPADPAYQQEILARLAELYNQGGKKIAKAAEVTESLKATVPAVPDKPAGDSAQAPLTGADPSKDTPGFNDYLVNVVYDRYGYEGGRPYTLHFFIAKDGERAIDFAASISSHDLRADPRHIGSIFTFSSRIEDREGRPICQNCINQKNAQELSEAQLPITLELVHRAQDSSIDFNEVDPASVTAYLEKNLTWVAVNTVGEVIPHEVLDKTKAYVVAGTSRISTELGSEEHPVTYYSGYSKLLEAGSTDPQWYRAE